MPKCMQCKRYCRKMYLLGCDTDGILVCNTCALSDERRTKCKGCYKPIHGRVYLVYYDGMNPEAHHKACYLSAIQVDSDTIDEYREVDMV